MAVGCDMPFLGAPLLAWLAARPEPLVVPSLDGRASAVPGPLPALAARGPRARARRGALDGTDALPRFPRACWPAPELAAFGDPERLCFNVNTSEDLARAEALLDQAPA